MKTLEEYVKHKKYLFNLTQALIPVVTAVIGLAAQLLYRKDINTCISGSVIIVFAVAALMFERRQTNLEKGFSYNNGRFPFRFFYLYLGALIIACILPLLPVSGWTYPVIALALAFFSTPLIGIIAVSILILISVILAGAGVYVFVLYFFSSVAAIIFFRKVDDEFKVGIPTVLTELFLLTGLLSEVTLFIPRHFTFEELAIPLLNIFVSGLLMIILLKIYSGQVVHKERDIYATINDQEFVLLAELKKSNPDRYLHTVHCAHLCGLVANALKMDLQLIKSGAYYNRIMDFAEMKDLYQKDEHTGDAQAFLLYLEKNHSFPSKVCDLLAECYNEKDKISSREAFVVMAVDRVVMSISNELAQNPNGKIDYKKYIDSIFEDIERGQSMLNCDISFHDFKECKRILKEAGLYYEFLRRKPN